MLQAWHRQINVQALRFNASTLMAKGIVMKVIITMIIIRVIIIIIIIIIQKSEDAKTPQVKTV